MHKSEEQCAIRVTFQDRVGVGVFELCQDDWGDPIGIVERWLEDNADTSPRGLPYVLGGEPNYQLVAI
ncbi:MAG: hypothetical protein PHT12_04550 [Patescibacteria group bacterium]|nr:hypothetical protein [Patescibacteria group bacterium]